MFDHVIVGIDGAEGGRDALALAKLLLHPDSELTLAHIYEGDELPWRGSSPPYSVLAQETARTLLEHAREEAGLDAELICHGGALVGRGLHELAESLKADLIVLGTSRRSLVGRVLIGDDTKAALNGAPCAVAVAPAGYSRQPSRLGSIGVGYDGSGESRHALEVARELSVQSGGKLEALEAVFVPARYVAGPVWPDAVTIEEMLAEARQRISEFADVEPHAVYGRPSEELALWSAGLDLLIVGSRGYGPVGRILHGSVAHELARTARCPLVVLNRAASVADASTALAAERTLRGSTVARRRRVSSSTELRDVRPRPTV